MLGKNPYIYRAQQAYDRGTALIRRMDSAFRAWTGVAYDPAITLAQFDRILQAILLNMALIDGRFHRLERRLIDRVADYGDLMDWLRANGVDMSWERAGALSENQRRSLLQRLPELLESTCNDFVRPLALADGADPADYLAQLEQELSEIAECLSLVDGEKQAEEQTAYVQMLRHLLTDRWKTIVAEG